MTAPTNNLWGNVLPLSNDQNWVQICPKLDYENFSRILQGKFFDYEEVRYDIPLDFDNGFEYIGVAANGADITAPVWSLIRLSYDANGKRAREQFMSGRSWANRSLGWS